LHTTCNGNLAEATKAWDKFTKQQKKTIGAALLEQHELTKELKTARWVAGSILGFTEHHNHPGRHPDEMRGAMLALASAVSFSDEEPKPSRKAITHMMGLPERDLKQVDEEINCKMKDLDIPFYVPAVKV
jgi:hypothetical protein